MVLISGPIPYIPLKLCMISPKFPYCRELMYIRSLGFVAHRHFLFSLLLSCSVYFTLLDEIIVEMTDRPPSIVINQQISVIATLRDPLRDHCLGIKRVVGQSGPLFHECHPTESKR